MRERGEKEREDVEFKGDSREREREIENDLTVKKREIYCFSLKHCNMKALLCDTLKHKSHLP